MITLGPTYPDTLRGRLMRLGSALAREPRRIDRLFAPLRRPLDRAWYRHSGRMRELGQLGESVSLMRTSPAVLASSSCRSECGRITPPTISDRACPSTPRCRVVFLTCGGGQPICEVGWGRRDVAAAVRPLRVVYRPGRGSRRLRSREARRRVPMGRDLRASARGAVGTLQRSPRFASVAWFARSAIHSVPNRPAIERDFRVGGGGRVGVRAHP